MITKDGIRKLFMGKEFDTSHHDVKLSESLETIRKQYLDEALKDFDNLYEGERDDAVFSFFLDFQASLAKVAMAEERRAYAMLLAECPLVMSRAGG